MKEKTLWISRTAIMIALLVALQFVTKSFGQFVTGSCVNVVLVVACICGGFWCGGVTAVVSPFLAFLLGIGPAMIQLVPVIALGNLALTAVISLMVKHGKASLPRDLLAVVLAALLKAALLYLLAVKLVAPFLALSEKQLSAITMMFSWPQLFTALVGGCLGVLAARAVNRSLKKR